ncbi:hypothetical protein PoMZ_10739 [Pyricularia oryzae]|uniref:Uncharacterized protein n=1 Tax=Pyricularia oryzae TaxID=318829 RepID=A0A4P7MYN0_PYROR|nr:hypothetical protein PoMZ_10739 [Pyricularia oryzae]
MAWTLKGRFTFSVARYRMSSNSPSGGTKLMIRSESNFPSLTHWWNWQSSSVTLPAAALVALLPMRFPDGRLIMPSPSRRSRSFSPNLHSGVPERYARMTIWPVTSARSTAPAADIKRFTSSMTSTNASFLRYLTSALRHDNAPVACIVILAESSGRCSDLTPSVVMYILSVSVSLIDKHKVVFDGLLVKLAKVTPPKLDEAVQKLKHESGVRIALGNGHQVDILVLDMAKGGASERQDRRTGFPSADDLNAEDVGKARATVISEAAEDEVFTFQVEKKHAGQHFELIENGRRTRR